MKTSQKAILLAVRSDKIDSNCYSPEDKINVHNRHIRREGWSYWGVNFRIDPDRFDFPVHVYLAKKGTGISQFRATMIDLEMYGERRPPKNLVHIPSEFAKMEFKTYFKISRIERLSKPRKVTSLKKLSDRNFVKGLNESYIGIYDPLP